MLFQSIAILFLLTWKQSQKTRERQKNEWEGKTGSHGRKMKQNVLNGTLELLPGNRFGLESKLPKQFAKFPENYSVLKKKKGLNSICAFWNTELNMYVSFRKRFSFSTKKDITEKKNIEGKGRGEQMFYKKAVLFKYFWLKSNFFCPEFYTVWFVLLYRNSWFQFIYNVCV